MNRILLSGLAVTILSLSSLHAMEDPSLGVLIMSEACKQVLLNQRDMHNQLPKGKHTTYVNSNTSKNTRWYHPITNNKWYIAAGTAGIGLFSFLTFKYYFRKK